MALGGSVVLILLDRLCGADLPRTGQMALDSSVVLIYQDLPFCVWWLCGADFTRLALWCLC